MTTTEVKIFSWNPTVASYVLNRLQMAQKAGTRTGVKRFSHTYVVTDIETGWRCKVTATDAELATINTLVAECLAAGYVATASPFHAAEGVAS